MCRIVGDAADLGPGEVTGGDGLSADAVPVGRDDGSGKQQEVAEPECDGAERQSDEKDPDAAVLL